MGQISRFPHDIEPVAAGEGSELARGAVKVIDIAGAVDLCHRPLHSIFIPFCKRSLLPGPLRVARLPVPGPFRDASEPRDTSTIRASEVLARACHENRARSLLYAAIASARQEVHVSVAAGVSRGKRQLSPSSLLAEIFGNEPTETQIGPTGNDSSQDVRGPMHAQISGCGNDVGTRTPAVISTDHRVMNRELGKEHPASSPLGLSFSAINSYRICPYSYYLQYVLCVSPPPSPRMVYGKAMHEAVAACLRGSGMGRNGPPPTLQTALEEFNRHLSGCAFESESQILQLTAQGEAGLKSFISRLVQGRTDGGTDAQLRVLIERKFRVRIPEAHVVLSGVFDRVDVVPGPDEASPARRLTITDYKTCVGAKRPESMVRDSLQLRLYSLAGERIFGVSPAEVVLESIEDGRRGTAVPDDAGGRAALEAISATADGVRGTRFCATPSFHSCSFCGFKHTCPHSAMKYAAL